MQIFIGILCIAAGIGVIVGAYWLEHSILHFGLAEKYLGPGGGTLGYKLVGLTLIAFGVAIGFGLLDLGGDTLNQSGANTEQEAPAATTPNNPAPVPSGGGNFAQ